MMALNASAPWHRGSFDRFLDDRLPQLLAARLPLSGYHAESTSPHTARVHITLGAAGQVAADYAIPQPDEEGLFQIEGKPHLVVPIASDERLDLAEVRCVGEQLLDYVSDRLGHAPQDLPWDESLARTWLPLDTWVREFLESHAQPLDDTNWLASRAHLRRILIPDRREVIAPGQFGRTCPFETPEGPNIGRVLSIAVGAEVRDGRLIVVDDRPEAALGLTASMVPFLEHSDANRLLFGVNMMRQWTIPPDPEPALVQTGSEPDAPGFWCGRNLLTAFVFWGPDTYEDGIVISESCARRLDYPRPVEPGDKLSNRHGTKGVVSRILPDDEMPHLSDGTPVELVFSFIGLHTRLNFGQILEALMSRIARAEGAPAIVPPFQSPPESELRSRLTRAGLPADGLETLTDGRSGTELLQPSPVGSVYWGKTAQTVEGKMFATVQASDGMFQGEFECYALRDAGAFENIAEQFNTRAAGRPEAESLAARAAAGPVEQAGPPTPGFAALARRLAAAGIVTKLGADRLTFQLQDPEHPALDLALPVPHPWLREHKLARLGAFDEIPQWDALVLANDRLARMLRSTTPESLTEKARADLEARVREYLDALLTPDDLRFRRRASFTGKTVLAPAADLRLDQVGLPDEISWTLFGPLVGRELGGEAEVSQQSERAASALDAVMARSWVLINRAPTFMPTCILAFHPVRRPERVIRLHPLACMLMNADFDGDQAAVLLPLTEAAQRQAGELLTVAGHLRRDPTLIRWLCPNHEMLWGLARLSLTEEGRYELSALAGVDIAGPEGFITRGSVTEALRLILDRDGVEKAIEIAERLMARGFEVTKRSGASMSPFIGASLARPPEPENPDAEAWANYAEEIADRIAARTDFMDTDLGPQILAVKSGARGSLLHLARLVGPHGAASDVSGNRVPIRHGFRDGLTADETYANVPSAREGLSRVAFESAQMGYGVRDASRTKAFTVLARAMRAPHPGPVFARAAAAGEVDPLTDLDSRLFVGLPPLHRR